MIKINQLTADNTKYCGLKTFADPFVLLSFQVQVQYYFAEETAHF